MQVRVEQTGAAELARDLARAPETIRATLAKEAFAVGTRSVRYIRQIYRTVGGPNSTWRRTGQLAGSYDQRVKRAGRDVELTVGAIKPTAGGQVPLHARVQEGFNFAGQRVAQFVIRAKNAPYLAFPIRQGGGLAKGNITGWVRVKEVTLIPRPALEPVSPSIIRALEDAAGRAAADAL